MPSGTASAGDEASLKAREDYARLDAAYLESLGIQEKLKGAESDEVARLSAAIGRERMLAGNVHGALPFLRRALAIREKSPGRDPRGLAGALDELAGATERAGNANEAIELHRRAAPLLEAADDEEALLTCVNQTALLLSDAYRFREAVPLFERALALEQKLRGNSSSLIAVISQNLALASANSGDHSKAERLYRDALARAERDRGPNSPLVAGILANLAGLYDETDRRRSAIPLYERALAIREQGDDRAALAIAVQDLALAHQKLAEFDEAEAGYVRAFGILKESGSAESEDAAQLLSNWASLCGDRGDFLRAEELGTRALALAEKLFGENGSKTAHPVNNLGDYYKELGQLDRAEALYRKAYAIWLRDFGPEHPQVAASLNNLGALYQTEGDYRRSREYLLKALAMIRKTQGQDHSDAALTLNNLASLELTRGNYSGAEPLFQQALATLEKVHGTDHPLVATALNNLGIVNLRLGDSQRAEALLARAVEIAERRGDKHALARSLLNVAVVYDQRNDVVRAEPLMRRALALFDEEKVEAPELAAVLLGLASVRGAHGDYVQAEQLLRRARGVARAAEGEASVGVARIDASLARVAADQGRYEEAETLYARVIAVFQKLFGSDHPELAEVLTNFAVMFWERGQGERAVPMMEKSMESRERYVSRTLATGSEEQRRLLVSASSAATDWVIDLYENGFPNDAQARRLALLAVLQSKGRVIEVMHETTRALREHLGPEERQLFDRLKAVRSRMARLAFAEDAARRPDQLRSELSDLTSEAQDLEAGISERSALFASVARPVTIEAVAARLPPGAALVEIVSHLRYDPREGPLNSWKERRYSAYVLGSDQSVSSVDLGPADAIDASVVAFREALRDPHSDVKKPARKLDEQVMRPIRRLLGATRNIIVSADGSLNLIPFGALVDEHQKYLIDDWSIRYLTTGRELLKPASAPSRTAALVVADPAFDATSTWGRAARSSAPAPGSVSRAERAVAGRFDQLPGAVDEGFAVAKSLGDAAVLSGSQASVGALLELKGPRLLHLATHGFFLGNEQSGTPSGYGIGPASVIPSASIPINPLLRSGLALAGANLGRSDDPGILTALEASSLDLWGTRLVVLSACDTGVGSVSNREGVYGLGRALMLAGADSLVASLWRVNDAAARDLMTAYYDALARGGNRASSLRDVQLELRRSERYDHPYYWAGFVALGAEGPLGPTPKLPPALPGLDSGARPPSAQPLGAARGCSCRLAAATRSNAPGAWLASLCAGALFVHRRSRGSSRRSGASPSSSRESRSCNPRSETRRRAAAAR